MAAYFSEYSQSRNSCTEPKEGGENERKKSRLWGLCALAWEKIIPAFCPQPRVKCFSLGSIKRQGCLPMLDVTSNSLILHTLLSISLLICIHLSLRTSQPLHQAKQPNKQGLMNNRRKDAARLLRENKWGCISCVRTTSVKWDLDQSSTCCWRTEEEERKKTLGKQRLLCLKEYFTYKMTGCLSITHPVLPWGKLCFSSMPTRWTKNQNIVKVFDELK